MRQFTLPLYFSIVYFFFFKITDRLFLQSLWSTFVIKHSLTLPKVPWPYHTGTLCFPQQSFLCMRSKDQAEQNTFFQRPVTLCSCPLLPPLVQPAVISHNGNGERSWWSRFHSEENRRIQSISTQTFKSMSTSGCVSFTSWRTWNKWQPLRRPSL